MDREARKAATLTLLEDLVRRARRAGADQADAVGVESVAHGASFRRGKPEDIERSESMDVGLRVLIGQRQAFVSSTDRQSAQLDQVVERAVAMAKLAPEDKFCGLADPAVLARDLPDLDLLDATPEPEIDQLIDQARQLEEAALAVPGVTNCEGASASASGGLVGLVTSGGFAGAYAGTSFSMSVSAIAGEGMRMQRDYDFTSGRHQSELADPAKIGKHAGERAIKRLDPRTMPSGKLPVVFDPRVAGSLLGHLAGAINGAGVARGTSFLKDQLGQQIFPAGVTIVDDPLRRRGPRSRPYDGEGVAVRRRAVIDNGVLTGWLLDTASARQLGLSTTGNAMRGAGSPPSPGVTNFYLEPGKMTPAELIADIDAGFYVTELIGFGVNGVTGDYSRGASGFWIDHGQITFPVDQMTIAGNLKEMFLHMTPANDLTFRYGTDSPTVRLDGMSIAGQ